MPPGTAKAELARREAERQKGTDEWTWSWRRIGRPEQHPTHDDWLIWLILAGRGWGKTRTGVEWVRAEVDAGRARRIAIVAETAADARDVIAEGPSGFLSVGPPEKRPLYESSKRRLTWPNGAIATLYNATEPDQLRGPQHDAAWCDELAKWAYAKPGSEAKSPGQETWDMLQFGLRMGSARCVVTTTPRPVPLVKAIMNTPRTLVTRGTTMDNAANLSPAFIQKIRARYAGTRLGRQELNAEILEDIPGALWTRGMFEVPGFRVDDAPDLARIVVAVDPSGARSADDDNADSIGIVVAGVGRDGRGYVLADRTCRLSPLGWGRIAVDAYREFKADRIIAERNFGGAMVEHVIRSMDARVSYAEVTASRGKIVRAEPVAAFYERLRVSHVGAPDKLELLEEQLCAMTSGGYLGEGSPDRVDALVWALTDLMEAPKPLHFSPEFMRKAAQPMRRQ